MPVFGQPATSAAVSRRNQRRGARNMRTIGAAVRVGALVAASMFMAAPGISAAAEHDGMGGMRHGDAGMEMGGHGGMSGMGGDHDKKKGEKLFSGRVGPWKGEARLIDMKAQMEQSGVSAKVAARFAGERHLMLFLTDPATGKPAAGVAGKVLITGPDAASSSKVKLVMMGGHIGTNVAMPTPGTYTFEADIESVDKKGSATFSYMLE